MPDNKKNNPNDNNGCLEGLIELWFMLILRAFAEFFSRIAVVVVIIILGIIFLVTTFSYKGSSSYSYEDLPSPPKTTSAPAPKVEISEEEKKLTEERRAAEIERNRKNAEENKRKMEALYGKQQNSEEKPQPQPESISTKQKMDMLIPISVKCKWKEADVREAVRVMESCGVRFNMLSAKEPAYDSGKNQFSFSIQDSMLRVRIEDNHISKILLEITSNTAVNYFREKSNQRVEPFKHTYSNDIVLYVKDGERELVNKNNFDEIIFSRAKLDKMKAQANNYVKSKGGNGFDNFSLRVAVQVETDTYNNSVKIPIEDAINGKVFFLSLIDYSTKSEIYGKDKDKYHAEILIDGDNIHEISLREN